MATRAIYYLKRQGKKYPSFICADGIIISNIAHREHFKTKKAALKVKSEQPDSEKWELVECTFKKDRPLTKKEQEDFQRKFRENLGFNW